MGPAVEFSTSSKQSTLQKTLTSALNELGLDASLIAIHTEDNGPLVAQVSRGLTPRDAQAILRALSLQEVTSKALERSSRAEGGESKVLRLRMITPGAKSLLAVPLQYEQRTYGMIVMGRKESAAFAKRESAAGEHRRGNYQIA